LRSEARLVMVVVELVDGDAFFGGEPPKDRGIKSG
jgi:hypothetical protein